jgi:hypothetical protein
MAAGVAANAPGGVHPGRFGLTFGPNRSKYCLNLATARHEIEHAREPACTDIIRFQHNNSSSHKAYGIAFIPGLHDVCMVFSKAEGRG